MYKVIKAVVAAGLVGMVSLSSPVYSAITPQEELEGKINYGVLDRLFDLVNENSLGCTTQGMQKKCIIRGIIKLKNGSILTYGISAIEYPPTRQLNIF